MATTAYLRVSTGSQGPPSSCKSMSQRRPSPRLSASASHHIPLYQDKAVTPTPLKDIFTPIWAGPLARRPLPRLRHRTNHSVLRHLKRPAAPKCATRTDLLSGPL